MRPQRRHAGAGGSLAGAEAGAALKGVHVGRASVTLLGLCLEGHWGATSAPLPALPFLVLSIPSEGRVGKLAQQGGKHRPAAVPCGPQVCCWALAGAEGLWGGEGGGTCLETATCKGRAGGTGGPVPQGLCRGLAMAGRDFQQCALGLP